MKARYWLGILFSFIWIVQAFAQGPLEMLQQTSDQMISALKTNKASMKKNSGVVYGIVNRILLPHVDLETMARSVVGRSYWMEATPAQRDEFKRLFTRQVTSTYATALSSYQDEKVKFYPIRGGGDRVQVQSVIIRSNGQNIPVSYRLINYGGNWKVYDFSVEGVSIVQSYSAQYANDLAQGGLANLLTHMRTRYGRG